MKQLLLALVTTITIALPVRAEVSADVVRLAQALRMDEIIAIMRSEGLKFGEQIADTMFPARGDGEWPRMVDRIHDEEWMYETVMEEFARALEGADVEAIRAIFESPLGQDIVALEISARKIMLDPIVEEDNARRVEQMRRDGDPRLEQIREFIEANDLIELNVAGTMNSDIAFYIGLNDGGAYENPITEEQILRDVWAEEDAVREDTEKWLYEFLTLAYSPLSDSDLEAYITFSRTEPGQHLNAALFAGFDAMFLKISYRLGRAAGVILSSDNL